jgi:uncharacterized protein with PQ loop repeat
MPLKLLSIVGLYVVEASYLPQLWRLYRLKEADEFSFLFPILNTVGRICGVIYSLTTNEASMAAFFITGIVLRCTLLAQVVFYRRRKRLRQPIGNSVSS